MKKGKKDEGRGGQSTSSTTETAEPTAERIRRVVMMDEKKAYEKHEEHKAQTGWTGFDIPRFKAEKSLRFEIPSKNEDEDMPGALVTSRRDIIQKPLSKTITVKRADPAYMKSAIYRNRHLIPYIGGILFGAWAGTLYILSSSYSARKFCSKYFTPPLHLFYYFADIVPYHEDPKNRTNTDLTYADRIRMKDARREEDAAKMRAIDEEDLVV